MSPLRMAYILLIAAVIALRLICASPPVIAFDQPKVLVSGGRTGEARGEFNPRVPDSAPLVTGRSVAARSSGANDSTNDADRKARDRVGALGFARR